MTECWRCSVYTERSHYNTTHDCYYITTTLLMPAITSLQPF